MYQAFTRRSGDLYGKSRVSAGENTQTVSERATVQWAAYMKSSFPDVYPLGMMACRRHRLPQDTPKRRAERGPSRKAFRRRDRVVPPPDVRAGQAQVRRPAAEVG